MSRRVFYGGSGSSGSGGGATFRSTAVTSAYAVPATETGTPVDSTSAGFLVTLPASPSANEVHTFADCTGQCGTNPVTFQGSVAIDGAGTFSLNWAWGVVTFQYLAAKTIWKVL